MALYYTVKEGVPLTCASNPLLLFAKNLFVGFYKVFNYIANNSVDKDLHNVQVATWK